MFSFSLFLCGKDGNSLLHLAADEGKIEYVKLLVGWGVDGRIINLVGRTDLLFMFILYCGV